MAQTKAKRLTPRRVYLNVGIKVAGVVIAFESIMLTAYTILSYIFLNNEDFLTRLHLEQQNIVVVTLVSSFVLAGYLTFLIITRIFDPVAVLIGGTEEIAKGNLDMKLEVKTNDELQILADRFNAMAAALKAERLSLENKVRERTRELEASQKKELERQKEVLHLKDEFLFVAAHELRTPVTSIRWSLEGVEGKKMPKDVKLAMDDAVHASENLARLVEDLLNMARLDSKRIEFEKQPVDLIAVINDVVQEMDPLAKKRGVALRAEISGELTAKALADARRVREVLVNLAGNAIKFNRTGGHVTIGAGVSGDKVRFYVEDDGPGIPLDEQQHLFEKFWRSKATTGVEGSGLGLFITKRLVEGMDGSISFESAPGKGTTFTALLPSERGFKR